MIQFAFNLSDDLAENNKFCHNIECNQYQGQGLVYLGSKRGIADRIYHAIINTLGGVKINRFVDLFCGGGWTKKRLYGEISGCLKKHTLGKLARK